MHHFDVSTRKGFFFLKCSKGEVKVRHQVKSTVCSPLGINWCKELAESGLQVDLQPEMVHQTKLTFSPLPVLIPRSNSYGKPVG